MKVLVSGGLGFIGSALVKALVREGYVVDVIDNMHTGSLRNIEDVREKVEVYIRDAGELPHKSYDVIFHQGVYSSSPMYKEDRSLVWKALRDWTSILEYARRRKCKIIFASTSSLYNGHSPPHHEGLPVLVKDFYTETRFMIERMAELYYKMHGVNSVGLRYFSCYGPNELHKENYANLVSQFLWCVRDGKPLLVYGNGSQTRDFIFVDDVVTANLRALEKIEEIECGVFNVGTGRETSLNELIKLIENSTQKNVQVRYVNNPIKNYVERTCADIKKALEVLGFKASVSLEEGIRRCWNAYSKV